MLSKRWKFAQEYELPYQMAKSLHPEILSISRNSKIYAEKFEEFLSNFTKITDDIRILEVGCGPTGAIFFMKTGKRFGIDPLIDHYHAKFKGIFDFGKVLLAKGVGEELPFKEESFDIVIIHNVLDHTDRAEIVIMEIKRILKKDGVVYIGINTYSAAVYYLHKIYELLLKILPGFMWKIMRIPVFWSHPNIINEHDLLKILDKSGLKPVFLKSRTPQEARKIFRNKRRGAIWYLLSFFLYSGGFTTIVVQK